MCRCNTNAFTHRRSYAETLYTQTFWHTDVFTHTLSRSLLHTVAFTSKRFYARTLLHTEAFTQRQCHAQKCTETFTHGRCYAHMRWHNKTCTKYFPALLRTTVYGGKRGREGGNKGGQKRGEGGLVLLVPQSLHGILLCTTKFAEKCQYYPVLLCIAKFGQITSSTTYYFVFQSLQKVFPSTILRTIKLVQEARRGESGRGATSTTSYYKVCTK
jgi:hypothetical protein